MIYKGNYKITSPFGPRNLNGDTRYHKGVDFVGLQSKEILAPCDGIIGSSTIITNRNNLTWQWGNYVRLDVGAYKLFFCHLAQRKVSAGQRVKKGDVLGIEGNTGYSFGSHCHFEVRNSSNQSINPIEFLESINKTDRDKVQEHFEFDDNTMKFLDQHKWKDALYKKLCKDIK